MTTETENNPINLQEAIELVLNEAESSAIGDSETNLSKRVLLATECIQAWYDEYGHQFQNYSY
jgi:hypothetical protein